MKNLWKHIFVVGVLLAVYLCWYNYPMMDAKRFSRALEQCRSNPETNQACGYHLLYPNARGPQ